MGLDRGHHNHSSPRLSTNRARVRSMAVGCCSLCESERLEDASPRARCGRLASVSAGVRQTLATPVSGRIVDVGVHVGRPARSQRRSEPGFAGARKPRCALPTADSQVRRRPPGSATLSSSPRSTPARVVLSFAAVGRLAIGVRDYEAKTSGLAIRVTSAISDTVTPGRSAITPNTAALFSAAPGARRWRTGRTGGPAPASAPAPTRLCCGASRRRLARLIAGAVERGVGRLQALVFGRCRSELLQPRTNPLHYLVNQIGHPSLSTCAPTPAGQTTIPATCCCPRHPLRRRLQARAAWAPAYWCTATFRDAVLSHRGG